MDNNLNSIVMKKIERTIENLEKNNMDAFYVENEVKLLEKLDEILKEGWTVSVGGSMTLFESGVIDYLRGGKFKFLDRYEYGLQPKDIKQIFRESFFADAYLTSSNALLESGELYNVDSNGNRVAAMLYGPDNIIVIVGLNKIVSSLDEAISRNKEISGPANCTRLNRKTPCIKVGQCLDCKSEDRICNNYVLIKRQVHKGRVKVFIVGKPLGY